MSLADTGALSASAISCALALMLPRRPLMVLIASLKLFWRPCLVPVPAFPLPQRDPLSFRGYQRSPGGKPFSPFFSGLGERTGMPISRVVSWYGGRTSG